MSKACLPPNYNSKLEDSSNLKNEVVGSESFLLQLLNELKF